MLLLLSVVASLFGIRLGVFGFLSGYLGVQILVVCLIALTNSVGGGNFGGAATLSFNNPSTIGAIVQTILL